MSKDKKQNGLIIMPLIFGFISALLLLVVFLNSPSNRYYNPDSGDKAYSDSASIAVMTPEIDSRTKTTREKNEQEKEAYVRERSDLAAQWAMADYTFIGIWIGLIGIGFIIWTLIESRKAAYFTEKALNETELANRRGQRAYIGITSVKSKKRTIKDGKFQGNAISRPSSEPMTVIIAIKNSGQTPAKNVTVLFNHVFGAVETEGDMPLPERLSFLGSLMPHGENFMEVDISGAEGIDWTALQTLIVDGSVKVHIYGIITYDDVFGVSRETHFHAYITKKAIDGTNFSIGSADRNYIT